MILWVDDHIFAPNSRIGETERVSLFHTAFHQGHTLFVGESPGSAQHERLNTWLSGMAEPLKAELCDIVGIVGRVSSGSADEARFPVACVSIRDNYANLRDMPAFAPGHAIRFMNQPLSILVENMINDANFLLRCAPRIWREALNQWQATGRLRFENAGGNGTELAILREFSQDTVALSRTGLPASAWKLRHFLVYDHDGASAERPGDGAKALAKECRNAGLTGRHHMLQRRKQENYCPKEALEKLVHAKLLNSELRENALRAIADHFKQPDRHYRNLPTTEAVSEDFFKNPFAQPISWVDDWFIRDGSSAEMVTICDAIKSVI